MMLLTVALVVFYVVLITVGAVLMLAQPDTFRRKRR